MEEDSDSDSDLGVLNRRIRARSKLQIEEKEGFCRSFRRYMMEFGDATDIQGIRYIVEDRSIVEKALWVIIMLVSMGACIYWMFYLINRFYRQPIIVSFQAKEEPIFSIPFPAITVCPETKHKSNFSYYKAKRKIHKERLAMAEDELYDYLDQLLLCDVDLEEETPLERDLRNKGNITRASQEYNTIFHKMQLRIDDYMYMCRWMGVLHNCSELFTPVLTSEGICHSFNIIHRKHIYSPNVVKDKYFYKGCDHRSHFSAKTLEYSEEVDVDAYPRRAAFSGADHSLKLFLMQKVKNIDSACKKGLAGFRIEIHNPQELPNPTKTYYRIPLDTSTTVSLTPQVIGTSSNVRKYSVDKRFCYLPNERKLKFFKTYNPQLCYKECLTNVTFKNCECVAFHMPRTKDMPICGPPKLDCVRRQEYELEKAEIEAAVKAGNGRLNEEDAYKPHQENSSYCDCHPLCNTLSYNLEMSVSGWDWKQYYRFHQQFGNKEVEDLDGTAMSMVVMYLKRDFYLSVIRQEIYGFTEFISSVGGLLNLFTGITFLSIIELLYFFSLRIICNKKMYGPWYGKVE